ncbi:hypothetical protein [uncultured Mediterranean phage uvDeep-CGR2-KM19-C37]|nr:hypothetical protein [uncultured Mediterranean phage uvDeep-CGR2-KM19-C37]
MPKKTTKQNPTTPRLDALREQRDALALESESVGLQVEVAAARAALNRTDIMEAGQMLADRAAYLHDTPGFGTGSRLTSSHPSNPQDRKQGRNRPIFETEQQLAGIRGIARVIAATDETGIGVLKNLTNYVIGSGFEYEAVAADHVETSDHLLRLVNGVINEFQDENKWRRTEREAFARTRRDGESFSRLHHVGGGHIQHRFIEPELVRAPTRHRSGDFSEFLGHVSLDWLFGIATNIGDVQTVHGYHVDWQGDGTDTEVVTVDEVEHIKLNVDSTVKRGLSDFYPVYQELERASKVLRNTGEGAAIQASIAYVRQHVLGRSAADIRSIRSGKDEYSLQRSTVDGGSRTDTYQSFKPGRVIDIDGGTEYQPGPMGSQRNPNFVLVTEATLRYVGTRWCMPEYMISGDASSANYASTLVAESPFIKFAMAEQQFYAEGFEGLLWKVLKIAHHFGRCGSKISFPQLKRLIKIQTTTPRVHVRNRLQETQVNQILHEKGIMSRQTWAQNEEIDYAAERQRMSDEPPLIITDDLNPESMPAGPVLETAANREVLGSAYP